MPNPFPLFSWGLTRARYLPPGLGAVFLLAAGNLSAATAGETLRTLPPANYVFLAIIAVVGWGFFAWLRQHSAAQLARAAARESHFRILFERSPDCVLLFDFTTARFSGCNDAALRLLACTPEWLIGRTPWDLAPPLQPDGTPSFEKAQQIIAKLGPMKSLNFEWTHLRGDGSSFPANISATAIEFSGKEVWFCVVRDITEAKLAEAQARELQSSLERRVAERTEELARANSQLRDVEQLLRNALATEQELNALKSNFVSMVSHEFRTPLGVIMVSAEVLQRYIDRLRPDQRAEHLESIIRSVRRMSGMMEDVLLLSRVEAGAVHFSPTEVNLRVLCGRVVDEVRSATNAAAPVQVNFAADMPVVASGDTKLIHHILTNLLSNAIKYSKQEPVELRLKRADDQAVIEVVDRGIGIPAADRERLFQTFQRGGNVGQVSGTGLGLVIVKRCCDVHGGSITFLSEENRGTTFMVSLPMFDKETTQSENLLS
jgi:PAS domain S-box-containing protein